MNGPTPIMLVMFNAVAGRRLKRRGSVTDDAGVPVWSCIGIGAFTLRILNEFPQLLPRHQYHVIVAQGLLEFRAAHDVVVALPPG